MVSRNRNEGNEGISFDNVNTVSGLHQRQMAAEETTPSVGWKHDNRWPRIHGQWIRYQAAQKCQHAGRQRVKNRDKSVCVSAKQPVTENGRYELINCVGSRGLSFIEIQPPTVSLLRILLLLFLPPSFVLPPSSTLFHSFSPPSPGFVLFPTPSPIRRYESEKKIDFVSTDLENETPWKGRIERTSNDN